MNENIYKGTNKLLLGIVLSVITYWLFAQSFLNIAPIVQDDLHLTDGSLNIGVSITSLFSGLFIVLIGGLSDQYGRLKYTYVGIILNISGSFLLVIANGFLPFLIGRILQGLSAAFIMPATISLVKSYYYGKDRQRALSYWSIGSWGGSGLCSLFGGLVSNYLGWRAIFIISIIVSVISFILIIGTPESKVEKSTKVSFDILGFIIFFISILSLNILISKGASFGWFSSLSILLLGISVVGLSIFIKFEKKNLNPFMDFNLFKNNKYLASTISNFLLNASAGTLIVINTYLQQSRNMSSANAGLLSLSYLVCVLVCIRIGERFLQKFGPKKPMIWGALITLVSICLMSLTMLSTGVYIFVVILAFGLFGIGLGIYATPSTDTAVTNVPEEKVGIASGIYKMASSLGGAFGVAISATLYSSLASSHHYNLGANLGFGINIIFCLLSMIIVIKLIRTK